MTDVASKTLSPVIACQQAMGKMHYVLPLLLLVIVLLGMWDRSLDRQIFLWINADIPRTLPDVLLPIWDTTMISLTNLGDTHVMLWIILLISLPWWMAAGKKSPEIFSLYFVAFAIVLFLATVMSQGLKELVGALRPAGMLPIESLHILGKTLKYYSFPSGHTVTAFAGMCILLPLIPAAWRWGAFTLAAGIGISRIGMGAHWPVDVAAGAFLGIVAGIMGWRSAFWLQQKVHGKSKIWKNVYRGIAILGLFILSANVAYTPFYEPEYHSIRLGLIALGLAVAIFFGQYQKGRLR